MMDFSKAYNRHEFISFLQNSFLPEDFVSTVGIFSLFPLYIS